MTSSETEASTVSGAQKGVRHGPDEQVAPVGVHVAEIRYHEQHGLGEVGAQPEHPRIRCVPVSGRRNQGDVARRKFLVGNTQVRE